MAQIFLLGDLPREGIQKIHREVWPFAKPPLTQHNKDNGNEDNDNKESLWTKSNEKICNKNV